MALDATLLLHADTLYRAGMGTENVGPMLHCLIKMLRPCSVLEVGAGYSSLFLADALVEATKEAGQDHRLLALESDHSDPARRSVLGPKAAAPYRPWLTICDDQSLPGSSALSVRQTLEDLHLSGHVIYLDRSFRGASACMDPQRLPIDFCWFDCGGPQDYVAFINEYWGLINEDGGILCMHFTMHSFGDAARPGAEFRLPSPILNEIRRQQGRAGVGSTIEVLSLVEPHKRRQGDVTLVRRRPSSETVRDRPLEEDCRILADPLAPLCDLTARPKDRKPCRNAL